MGAVIVYVHGLWLPGSESFLLRRRLAHAMGIETRTFVYRSVAAGIDENARALRRYLDTVSADTLHLVAHSMGGLVVLEMFERQQASGRGELPPGRIVFTGSPVRGSRTAQRVARLPLGKTLLGSTVGDVLLVSRERRWAGGRDLGVIAGDLAVGLGRLLGPINAPNDGTVLVDETHLPGATEHLRVHVSHTGMVFSAAVARQVAAFLRDGRFER